MTDGEERNILMNRIRRYGKLIIHTANKKIL